VSILELFQWLEYSPPLVAMRSSPWFFPLIASVHLLGLTLLGGSVLLVDLRLLGLGLSRQTAADLARDAQPWLLTGLALLLPTGVLLFLCFATKYYYLSAFWVKVVSLHLVLTLTFTLRRRVTRVETPAIWQKSVAVVSLSLWTVVALAGRVIGLP
jgi:hypothetical protein